MPLFKYTQVGTPLPRGGDDVQAQRVTPRQASRIPGAGGGEREAAGGGGATGGGVGARRLNPVDP